MNGGWRRTYPAHNYILSRESDGVILIIQTADDSEDPGHLLELNLVDAWLRTSPLNHCRDNTGFPDGTFLETRWELLIRSASGFGRGCDRSGATRFNFYLVLDISQYI